jgi:hypothetical protein
LVRVAEEVEIRLKMTVPGSKTYYLSRLRVVYLLAVKKISLIGNLLVLLVLFSNTGCKKDKFITDPASLLSFSQDSVLFDTVFTSIGSSTQNFRVRNTHNQKIKISSIQLLGGSSSQFIINVDGSPGRTFSDIEIAAHDSMYIFVQVNVNPTNQNSPLIISDAIRFVVNGKEQTVILEAWGQDAYYHYPNHAIKFKDGSYLPYSLADSLKEAYTMVGGEIVWKNDKPHVIYGYLVVDEGQKLQIPAGTRVYLNYKAGLWVYRYGQIRVLGQKGNEVLFQGARREKDFADEPGQWDRIWINEGSDRNEINYAIIKNGYIGVQTDIFGDTIGLPGRLKLTNSKIQNMSKWGVYCLGYQLYAGNNVISNCQEHSVNLLLGGTYTFIHCTISNLWSKDKVREKPTVNINNYTEQQVLPLDSAYFGNCIIDGRLENEIALDLKTSDTFTPSYVFSNSWLKTNANTDDASHYISVRKGNDIRYKDVDGYNFEPSPDETQIRGFTHINATRDAIKFKLDLNAKSRSFSIATGGVTAGAYEF